MIKFPTTVAAFANACDGLPRVRLLQKFTCPRSGDSFKKGSLFNVDVNGSLWLVGSKVYKYQMSPAIRLFPESILDELHWENACES